MIIFCFQRTSAVDQRNVSVWDCDTAILPRLKNRRGTTIQMPLQSTWLDYESYSQRPKNMAGVIDSYSRVIFPGLFVAFVVSYWPISLLIHT